ncbi:MAG: ATP-grasp domain-containing protein [Pirellulaceae bacterium]
MKPLGATSDRPVTYAIGASCRSLAQSLVQWSDLGGACDQFADRDLPCPALAPAWRLLRNADLAASRRSSPPWLFLAGGMEHQRGCLRWLSGAMSLAAPSLPAMARLRHLRAWQRWAKRSGCRFPQTFPLRSQPARPQGNGFRGDNPRWLIKSLHHAGGFHVTPWLPAIAPDPSRHWLLQRWIEGRSFGTFFLTRPGQVRFLGCVEHWNADHLPAPAPHAFRGGWGPAPQRQEVCDSWIRFAEVVQDDLPALGLWQADWMVPEQGPPYLLEINPRWTGLTELVERWSGQNLSHAHWECVAGKPTEDRSWPSGRKPATDLLWGKSIHYARSNGQVDSPTAQWLWDHRFQGSTGPANPATGLRYLADLPHANAAIEEGAPILSAVTVGTSSSHLIAAATAFDQQLQRRLFYGKESVPLLPGSREKGEA